MCAVTMLIVSKFMQSPAVKLGKRPTKQAFSSGVHRRHQTLSVGGQQAFTHTGHNRFIEIDTAAKRFLSLFLISDIDRHTTYESRLFVGAGYREFAYDRVVKDTIVFDLCLEELASGTA